MGLSTSHIQDSKVLMKNLMHFKAFAVYRTKPQVFVLINLSYRLYCQFSVKDLV